MTLCASRAQAPPSEPAVPRRQGSGIRNALIRCPRTASPAGSSDSEASIATNTAAMPPYPIERRKPCGNSSRLASASVTVMPETATVRPAVRIVRTTASRTSYPARSSSRNRLTMNSE